MSDSESDIIETYSNDSSNNVCSDELIVDDVYKDWKELLKNYKNMLVYDTMGSSSISQESLIKNNYFPIPDYRNHENRYWIYKNN